MHRLLLPLLALFALPSVAQDKAPPRTLRVLSYNVHHAEGLDKKLDLPRIANIIRAAEADLVALQEIDVNTRRTGNVDQAAELAKLTGLHVYFAKAMDYQGGQYGQAILSRYPLTDTKTHPLPPAEQGVEPRIAGQARVTIGDQPLVFLTTHLDHQNEQRRLKQTAELARITATLKDTPAILAGDFNAVPTSTPIATIAEHWTDATAGEKMLTIPSESPNKKIDYIFYRPKDRLRVVESKVLDEPVASDHRPVLTVFEFPAR